MSESDPYQDEAWNEEMEADYKPSASALAAQPLATKITKSKPANLAKPTEEQWDEPLWTEELPDTKTEARFWGNLGLRLTKGIRKAEIRKLSVKDRVAAASVCFDKKQLLLDKPTANINFEARRTIYESVPALYAELERRKREQSTIDITPNEGEE